MDVSVVQMIVGFALGFGLVVLGGVVDNALFH